ncbi:MAG: hypothetical protein PWQ46_106 [Methanomicrobiaceae archaeon]|jgi:hypothetical protein|nr:hypothetical protein [Methanomicrobiaceae archaeon]
MLATAIRATIKIVNPTRKSIENNPSSFLSPI